MQALNGVTLTGIERTFNEDELIVSKTDLSGKLTYGNQLFYDLAGLSEGECIGAQHNIIRHPDMPRCVFDLLWSTLKAGKEIFAYVINRSSNGDHYWVFAHVTPSFNRMGEILGYHSNRRAPNKRILSDHIIPLYRNLREIEKADPSPKAGMEKSRAAISELLDSRSLEFNEFMFSLGA